MQTIQVQAIQTAARILGNQAALARALGVTAPVIGQWLSLDASSGRGVPPKQCVRIERLTDGKVTRRDLRPDDYWEIWPDLPPALASTAQAATETVAEQGAAHV